MAAFWFSCPRPFNLAGKWTPVVNGVGVYFENFVMIGLTADAGDKFKNQAPIPLAPCKYGANHVCFLKYWIDSSNAGGGRSSKIITRCGILYAHTEVNSLANQGYVISTGTQTIWQFIMHPHPAITKQYLNTSPPWHECNFTMVPLWLKTAELVRRWLLRASTYIAVLCFMQVRSYFTLYSRLVLL